MDELKNTITLFVLREGDMENIEAFGDALTGVWNITQLQFINYKDLPDYLKENGYSYFFISTAYYRSENVTSTWMFLNLVIPKSKYNKKGKRVDYSVYYSRNDLYPDNSTMFNTSIYGSVKNKEALSRMRKDTLFLPEYALTKFQKFTGGENEMLDPKDIFKKYPYAYKVLPVEEFSAKMAKATKETFFLDYVKSSAQKHISVYSTTEGLIYKNHKAMSYNLKDKDIKDLF